jgi:hypothetical protein
MSSIDSGTKARLFLAKRQLNSFFVLRELKRREVIPMFYEFEEENEEEKKEPQSGLTAQRFLFLPEDLPE